MSRKEMMIDPSGRPLENAGFEAAYALAIVVAWVVIVGAIFAFLGQTEAEAGPWPSAALLVLTGVSWGLAEVIARRQGLIWPGSALGIVGPLSLGYAVALSTPELREGPFQDRLAMVAFTAGLAMVPFLFRFRLPGLVSPIITFTLFGIFLSLYGTNMEKLREVEGFSPRGIIAALLTEAWVGILFGVLAFSATVMARRLDLRGDNFGLAAARPLHLIGAGIVALVAGRVLALLPGPFDLITLGLAWLAAIAWTMRVNRVAVMFACHFAMAKPAVFAITERMGVTLTLEQWSILLTYVILFDMLIWPFLHYWSAKIGWTLGPGGRAPPDRPGALWRYWPYATAEQLDRWEERRKERRASRRRFARLFRRDRLPKPSTATEDT